MWDKVVILNVGRGDERSRTKERSFLLGDGVDADARI